MRFFQSFIALVASVSAQQAVNQILNPGANSVIQAGGGVQSLTWGNPSPGNVSVALFSGSNPVITVAPLADNIANTGTFLWTPETWLPSGNDYTIGVTDLTGSTPVQYSPFFTIQLCSTCSSSTRSTTSSFAVATVSVSGLEIGTRTDVAFPTQAALISAASSGALSSGVANTASGTAASSAAASSGAAGAGGAVASASASRGSSAVMSAASRAASAGAAGASGASGASGSAGAAGAAATTASTTRSGAVLVQSSAALAFCLGAAVLLL